MTSGILPLLTTLENSEEPFCRVEMITLSYHKLTEIYYQQSLELRKNRSLQAQGSGWYLKHVLSLIIWIHFLRESITSIKLIRKKCEFLFPQLKRFGHNAPEVIKINSLLKSKIGFPVTILIFIAL